MLKGRRKGANMARGIFAFLWIVLAGFSGYYLFTLLNDPAALGGQTFQLGAVTGEGPPTGAAPPTAPPPAAMPPKEGPTSTADITALKNSLQGLSQQIAQLDARLKPIEKFVGPVAALPPATSVTTSPPAPAAPPAADTAAQSTQETEAPVEEEEVEVEETETEVETPAEPEPQAEATPPPPEPAPEPEETAEAPEPPAVAAAPMEDESDGADTSAADAEEAPASTEDVEIAEFDPVALPPTANDGSTRYGIEIGAVKKRDELRPLWREFLTKHAALVAGLQPRRVKAPDNSWRLIAGPFANAQDAEGACSLFKKADRPCSATVYAGDAL